MRMLPQLLLLPGVGGLCFGWLGVNIASGRRRFNEMAGMIFWAVGVSGGILLIVGASWWMLRARSCPLKGFTTT